MKIVSIGDTHGREVASAVKEIIDEHDKFIFVGDYVDSFDIPDKNIHKSLLEIIELKILYPSKIILLWGNHDIQYLLGYSKHGCSGYRRSMHKILDDIFTEYKLLFQLSHQINDTIWTHAGIHEGWFRYRFKPIIEQGKLLGDTLEDQLNFAFTREIPALFDVGRRRGGYYDIGGPLWCDMSELKSSPLRSYNQIVGHTRIKHIQKMNLHNKEIVFIDVLEDSDFISPNLFYYKEIKDE